MRKLGNLLTAEWKKALSIGLMTVACTITSAHSAVLTVGAGQQFPNPGEASHAAQSGDVIKIAPGTYYDCAIWTANNLTIEGAGAGTILTDKICQEKAIFVISGSNVTVRGITFARARANDGNGAGIRAEGKNLTINKSKFVNNQDGILAGDNAESTIAITDSEFDHDGVCLQACSHGVYVGHIAELRIERTKFFDTQQGHDVKSRAIKTVLTSSQLVDGPNGTASYKVDIPNGGALIMTDNILEKGPKNENHTAAVMIGEEGVSQPTQELTFKKNRFSNDGPHTAMVKNLTATPALLVGNVIKGSVTPLIGDGSVH